MKLGKLQEIDIRKVWQHEQYDFSKWLASEENIQELGDALNLSLTDVETVINWLKLVPPCKEPNGIEFNVTPHGLKLISCRNPHFEFTTHAEVVGAEPRAVLTLDREIILRMLMQGYTILQANSDCALPVLASGGSGQYIAMPIRTIPKPKEEKNMEMESVIYVEEEIDNLRSDMTN